MCEGTTATMWFCTTHAGCQRLEVGCWLLVVSRSRQDQRQQPRGAVSGCIRSCRPIRRCVPRTDLGVEKEHLGASRARFIRKQGTGEGKEGAGSTLIWKI